MKQCIAAIILLPPKNEAPPERSDTALLPVPKNEREADGIANERMQMIVMMTMTMMMTQLLWRWKSSDNEDDELADNGKK